jgi:hypothetical protein
VPCEDPTVVTRFVDKDTAVLETGVALDTLKKIDTLLREISNRYKDYCGSYVEKKIIWLIQVKRDSIRSLKRQLTGLKASLEAISDEDWKPTTKIVAMIYRSASGHMRITRTLGDLLPCTQKTLADPEFEDTFPGEPWEKSCLEGHFRSQLALWL